jgi:hypothetical protein
MIKLCATKVQACPHLPATLHCNISMYTQTELCVILIIPSLCYLLRNVPLDHAYRIPVDFIHIIFSIVCSESSCSLTKDVGSDVHQRLYRPALWTKRLNTLSVLHFNRCLTTVQVYSRTAAHFNGNFDTYNQIYVPWPKRTATFRTHGINNMNVPTAFSRPDRRISE